MKPRPLDPFLICALTLALTVSRTGAQTNIPYIPLPPGQDLPTNAIVHLPQEYPSSPFSAATADSPTASPSFLALDDNNAVWPPDTQGAVGVSNVVTMLNSQVRIQTRLGTNVSTVLFSDWWTNTYAYAAR